MAFLQKLQISGLRSFGPNDDDRQIMDFFNEIQTNKRDRNGRPIKDVRVWPLTLILGPNGSGKTTIIECLKYVTTGDYPPGSHSGRSFIHDPKMAGEVSVRGCVKLLFRGADGGFYVISRGLEATQKAKTITIKTLDGTFSKKVDNQLKSLSMKCADINAHILQNLGVTKAILNYVVFCHQEDSNWPLEEGSKVKQKFDEIFDSDKYQGCLKEIKLVRQEKMSETKSLSTHIMYLKDIKQEADRKKSELEGEKNRIGILQDQIESCKDQLKPIDEQIAKIRQLETNYSGIVSEKSKQETLYDEKIRQVDELKKSLTFKYDFDTEDEYENLRRQENLHCDQLDSNLENVKEQISTARQSMIAIDREIGIKMGQLGECRATQSAHEKTKAHFLQKFLEVSQNYNLEAEGLERVTEENVHEIKNKMEELMLNEEKKLQKVEQQFEAKIDAQNQLILQKTSDNKLVQDKVHRLETSQADTRSKIVEISDRIKTAAGATEEIEQLKSDQDAKEKELADLKKSSNLDDLNKKVEFKKRDLENLEKEEKAFREEKSVFECNFKVMTEIKAKEKDMDQKSEDVQTNLNKCNSSLREIFDKVFQMSEVSGLQSKFSQALDKLTNEKQGVDSEIQNLLRSQDFNQDKKKHLKLEIQKGKKKIEECKAKIGEDFNFDEDIDEKIDQLKLQIGEEEDKLKIKEANKFTFKDYIKRIDDSIASKRKDHSCPTCQRAFKDQHEVEDLKEDLVRHVKMIEKRLKSSKESLEASKTQLEKLQFMRPEIRQMKESSDEIDSKEKSLKEFEFKIGQQDKVLKEKRQILDELSAKLDCCGSIRDKVSKIDTLHGQIQILEREINDLKFEVDGVDTSKGLDFYQKKEAELTRKILACKKEIEVKQNRSNSLKNKMDALEKEIMTLNSNRLRLEKDQLDVASLVKEKSKFTQELEITKRELKVALESLKDMEDDILSLEKERNKLNALKSNEVKKCGGVLSKIRNSNIEIQKLADDIMTYRRGDNERLSKEHERAIGDMKNQKKLKENTVFQWEAKKDNLEQDIQRQNVKMRGIDDNITMFRCMEVAKECKKKILDLEKRLDINNLKRELAKKERYQKEKGELEGQISEKMGRLSENTLKVKKLERELREDKFKSAAEKFKQKRIEFRCTQHVINDLEKYYKALNYAITRFHNEKMKVINKYIRELWKQTYKGNDIDYIEIKTDEMDPNASSDKRKVCNYRVVMVKNNTEMEMRGRCSAGQKVLASLLIRLALAETFSLNCGIIALDEPTTNLDRENIDSLAEALANIVEKRSEANKNFQLIVITHDEELMHALSKQVSQQNYYYKISRNNKGLSQIRKYNSETASGY